MRYYVISQDGQKYGPADIPTLNQWAAEGRLLAHQMLEEESSGVRQVASSVAGINFGQQQQQTYAPSGQAYQQYPRSSYSGDDGSKDMTTAWICGVLGICCCAILSIVGLLAANRAGQKGHPQAMAAKVLNIVGLVLWALYVGFNMLAVAMGGARGFPGLG